MKIFIKLVAILVAVLLCLTPLGGCGYKTENAYIYFELPKVPLTLDPQTASEDAELLIIKNIYEGLLRKDSDGNIVNGAVESYKKDGLTYTFNIREDAVWSNGDDLTAHDFVFAFKRALDPETKAPFASRLMCISGASEINAGKASLDNLGVTALDNKTLKIALSYDDADFENTLTTSIAMPCNKKLFNESAGKYGLFKDFILSNGSYKLTKWNKTSFGIRLYRHEEYTGDFYAKNAAVFLTCNDKEEVNNKLKNNNIDIAFVNSADTPDLEASGLKIKSYQNICWVMTISNEFSYEMRKALAMLIGGEIYSGSLSAGYSAAQSIFPSVITKNPPADGITIYNLEAGKSKYITELSKLKDNKFPSDTILYYYDNGNIKSVVTDIVGHWQSNLSAFVNIEAASSSEVLMPQLSDTTLPMAIFSIRADSDDPIEYLKKFGVNYNGEGLAEAQSKILKDCKVIPLAFQDTCIAYSPALTNLSTTPDNGFIDFAFIVKTE